MRKFDVEDFPSLLGNHSNGHLNFKCQNKMSSFLLQIRQLSFNFQTKKLKFTISVTAIEKKKVKKKLLALYFKLIF
jgi:hypothetical protein